VSHKKSESMKVQDRRPYGDFIDTRCGVSSPIQSPIQSLAASPPQEIVLEIVLEMTLHGRLHLYYLHAVSYLGLFLTTCPNQNIRLYTSSNRFICRWLDIQKNTDLVQYSLWNNFASLRCGGDEI
jgi:hypothetical protein